jgi:hypothetical protein
MLATPSMLLMTTRLLVDLVKAGRAKDSDLVQAIVQSTESTAAELQVVKDIDPSPERYMKALASTAVVYMQVNSVFFELLQHLSLPPNRERRCNRYAVALVAAARLGSIPEMMFLIEEKGADVNCDDVFFGTPLGAATYGGHEPAMPST